MFQALPQATDFGTDMFTCFFPSRSWACVISSFCQMFPFSFFESLPTCVCSSMRKGINFSCKCLASLKLEFWKQRWVSLSPSSSPWIPVLPYFPLLHVIVFLAAYLADLSQVYHQRLKQQMKNFVASSQITYGKVHIINSIYYIFPNGYVALIKSACYINIYVIY